MSLSFPRGAPGAPLLSQGRGPDTGPRWPGRVSRTSRRSSGPKNTAGDGRARTPDRPTGRDTQTNSRARGAGAAAGPVLAPPSRPGRPLAAQPLRARAFLESGGGRRGAYLRAQRRRGAAHSLPAAMFPLRSERGRTRGGGGRGRLRRAAAASRPAGWRAAGGSTEAAAALAQAGAGRGLPGPAPRASGRGVASASAVGPAPGGRCGEGAAERPGPASLSCLPPPAFDPWAQTRVPTGPTRRVSRVGKLRSGEGSGTWVRVPLSPL